MRARHLPRAIVLVLLSSVALVLAGTPAVAAPVERGPVGPCHPGYETRDYQAGSVVWGNSKSGVVDLRAYDQDQRMEFTETLGMRFAVSVHGSATIGAQRVVEVNAEFGWQVEHELTFERQTKVDWTFAAGKLSHWRIGYAVQHINVTETVVDSNCNESTNRYTFDIAGQYQAIADVNHAMYDTVMRHPVANFGGSQLRTTSAGAPLYFDDFGGAKRWYTPGQFSGTGDGGGGGGGGGGTTPAVPAPTGQAAIPMPNNGVEVFARGSNNHLVQWSYRPSTGWRTADLGGDIRGIPVAVATSGGGVEVFALGADNTLREWWYTADNGWRTANLGGSIASSPTAFFDRSTGLIEVFARGTNNHLIEFWYLPSSGWTESDMGGDIRDSPTVVHTGGWGMEVFARGADDTLREWWYTPANGWRSASQGGSIASAPTAFVDKPTGLIEVFARGTNNHLIEFWYLPSSGWTESDMGGDIRDAPVAFQTTGWGTEVFARGADNSLQEWWYTPADGWRSASKGGSIASGPTGYFQAVDGLIEVFARGTNNHLIEFWYLPSSGWTESDMGGDIGDV